MQALWKREGVSNNTLMVIEYEGSIEPERIERALARFLDVCPWPAARLRRPFPWGALHWAAGARAMRQTPPVRRQRLGAPEALHAELEAELNAPIDPRREPPLRFAIFDGLGEQFKVMELYFKQYACCAFIHPGLDGLLAIQAAEGVRPGEIRRITLRFPASGYKIIDDNPLRSHCAQYVLALAAHKGAVDFYDILHDQRSDPSIRSLSERVQVIGDADLDRTYPSLYRSVVEVDTARGKHVRDIVHPRGSPESPLARDELRAKFSRLTSEVLSARRRDEIAQAVEGLEVIGDIGILSRLLSRSA